MRHIFQEMLANELPHSYSLQKIVGSHPIPTLRLTDFIYNMVMVKGKTLQQQLLVEENNVDLHLALAEAG